MRIGSRVGMAVAGAMIAAATVSVAAEDKAVQRVLVPLGGSVSEPPGDHFGVYVPTRFGGELTIGATGGWVRSPVPMAARAEWTGRRHEPARWYHLHGDRADKPYTVETIRSGRAKHAQALELLLLADQGRRDPRALGRRQRPGRHHASRWRRHPGRHARRLHRAGPGYRPAPAPTACSKPPSPRATTRPGSPTFMTT